MPHRRPLTQQEGWLAPHSRFRSASPDVYAEYIVSTCRSGWRAADMPLCFRQRSCPHSFLSQMLHSAPSGGESCSTRLRRAGCVDLPTHLTSHRDGATAMFRKLCGWLAPRDGCSCLPCFTECRRSELCPPPSANSAVAPPLPSGSPLHCPAAVRTGALPLPSASVFRQPRASKPVRPRTRRSWPCSASCSARWSLSCGPRRGTASCCSATACLPRTSPRSGGSACGSCGSRLHQRASTRRTSGT
mmetsp:Transcript_12624/g.37764  ORF Transcript_12624/g.37764 Transcript_12624/m.37764 type:complete len:245 (-) Transcript_12624:593-1327(-)